MLPWPLGVELVHVEGALAGREIEGDDDAKPGFGIHIDKRTRVAARCDGPACKEASEPVALAVGLGDGSALCRVGLIPQACRS